jgi:DNA-binding MarR family transcriptional regulator
VYLQFLGSKESRARTNPAKKLDSLEILLLEQVLLSDYRNQALLVSDLIAFRQLGSPATLHGRLKALISKGFLKTSSSERDARMKYIHPDKAGLRYAAFMSQCMNPSKANKT